MTPRTGRPKSENPKIKQLGVRFDENDLKKIDTLTAYYNETRVEVLRRGVNKLYSEINKKNNSSST